MSSVGVAGGPAAPGAGESQARAARGPWKGSRGRALRLFLGSVAVIGGDATRQRAGPQQQLLFIN